MTSRGQGETPATGHHLRLVHTKTLALRSANVLGATRCSAQRVQVMLSSSGALSMLQAGTCEHAQSPQCALNLILLRQSHIFFQAFHSYLNHDAVCGWQRHRANL